MLRRIRIQGYKSLHDLEVTLGPLCVLFGPNASGKSNFLDALQLLSRLGTKQTLKDAFEPPYRGTPLESFSFGPGGSRELLSRETPRQMMLEADVEFSDPVIEAVHEQIRQMRSPRRPSGGAGQSWIRERHLRYRIGLEIWPKTGMLRVVDEYLAALTKDGAPKQSRKPFLERVGERIHLRMEGQAHPTYHDLHLDHSLLSRPLYAPHYPHVAALRQEFANWLFFYFEPRERMRAGNPVKEVRHIGLMGEELTGFLNTLRALDPPQFKAVQRALRLIVPSATSLDVSVNELGEAELSLLEGNIPFPARVLSEGTLRVLGLLALGGAKEPPALIGFEEPENGIHPRRVRLVAEYLKVRAQTGETQIFVTTHSPILPDLMPEH